MTDMHNLKESSALSLQQYKELQNILEKNKVDAVSKLSSSPQKDRAVELLESLLSFIEELEKRFRKTNLESIPVIEVGQTHADFLSKELMPNADSFKNDWHDCLNSEWGKNQSLLRKLKFMMSGNQETEESSTKYSGALNDLINFWVNTLSDEEEDDYSEFTEICTELSEIVNSAWFAPDAWKKRLNKLRPMLLPTGAKSRLRDHIKVRIDEIYRAFTFGQFMAVVSLCRTLLEFTLKQNAGKLNIILTNENGWEKSLSQIIQEVSIRYPELSVHAEAIREQGNLVIHPKKRSIVAIPRVLEKEALETIEHIVVIIEWIYSKKQTLGLKGINTK